MKEKLFDLTGKTALVTGSTQGIGFDIAKELAAHRAQVFVNGASSEEKCAAAAAQIPGATPIRADLLSEDGIETLYAKTGDVDILVLNASIQYKHAWDEFSPEEYDRQLDCNLKSSYWLIRRYAPGMKARKWGRIVTIGSVNQYNQHPELSLYGVTKAAQLKLVKNIAGALAPHGVTVNNVAPGAIATPRNQAITDDPALRAAVEQKIPAGRFGKPEDISPTVLLLCSEAGSYITGADIVIDGGMSLR